MICDVVGVVVECFLQSDVELCLVHAEVKEVQVEYEDVDESATDILNGLAIVDASEVV